MNEDSEITEVTDWIYDILHEGGSIELTDYDLGYQDGFQRRSPRPLLYTHLRSEYDLGYEDGMGDKAILDEEFELRISEMCRVLGF
jgi:hypothetical protein